MALFLWFTDKTPEWVLYDLILGWNAKMSADVTNGGAAQGGVDQSRRNGTWSVPTSGMEGGRAQHPEARRPLRHAVKFGRILNLPDPKVVEIKNGQA